MTSSRAVLILSLSMAMAACLARPGVSGDAEDAGPDPTNDGPVEAGGPHQEPKEKAPKPDGGPKGGGPKAEKDGDKGPDSGPPRDDASLP